MEVGRGSCRAPSNVSTSDKSEPPTLNIQRPTPNARVPPAPRERKGDIPVAQCHPTWVGAASPTEIGRGMNGKGMEPSASAFHSSAVHSPAFTSGSYCGLAEWWSRGLWWPQFFSAEVSVDQRFTSSGSRSPLQFAPVREIRVRVPVPFVPTLQALAVLCSCFLGLHPRLSNAAPLALK